jgi:pimeloyl-ACP methyl ester carboxylesterase
MKDKHFELGIPDEAPSTGLSRRAMLKSGVAVAMAGGTGLITGNSSEARAQQLRPQAGPTRDTRTLDASAEAKKIGYDRTGSGERVLFLSGFPQTRRSWNKLTPLLKSKFEVITADLPSFGDSAIMQAPATTENAARVLHEFVQNIGAPIHVVAHDFGAWVAYAWSLLFPADFKTLTLIDAGIPGVTLTSEVELADYFRKWNFVFQMLPDLPAQLTQGKEDIYVGWWFKNKVHSPGAVAQEDVDAYVAAYARPGRMDAAFDYCRQILEDMRFNKEHYHVKSAIPLLAVGGQYAIPTMGESLKPFFQQCKSVVIANSGHFVPEEQPEELAKALLAFL